MRLAFPALFRTVAGVGAVATLAVIVAHPARLQSAAIPWYGYGGDGQHTNVSHTSAKGLGLVKWSTEVDMFPQYAGSSHYACPAISSKNTVVLGVKTGETDGFKFEGLSGVDGSTKWTQLTDYSVPPRSSTSWTNIYPIGLAGVAAVGAGGGGTVYVKTNADEATSAVKRFCFYQTLSFYDKNPAKYVDIKINTPISGNRTGAYFFGYRAYGNTPAELVPKLAHGGIAKMTTSGPSTYKKANDLIPCDATDDVFPAYNAVPAISNDGKAIYSAIVNRSKGQSYLVELDAMTLKPLNTARLVDPANGLDVWICTCSSASPMVAPDNQVFFGVLRNGDRTSHGWMLQFDKDLKPTDAAGHRFPVGGFGWDDTPSVVPAYLVQKYKGKSPYLLLTKYNNYKGTGGDGRNRLAVLDPKNDNLTFDPVTGKLHTMNEILTVLGVTCDSEFYSCTATTNTNDPKVPVREWCINAAAIDPVKHSAIVNSEDGHAYRWNFDTNTLKEGTYLAPATGEPYTPTAIGPDGTSYAINNGRLHAIVPAKVAP